MFSSNNTTEEEFQTACRLGGIVNLDDITLLDTFTQVVGKLPEKVCCRYNPGGVFTLGESRDGAQVMDTPGDAKYGMTRPQLAEAFAPGYRKGLITHHLGVLRLTLPGILRYEWERWEDGSGATSGATPPPTVPSGG